MKRIIILNSLLFVIFAGSALAVISGDTSVEGYFNVDGDSELYGKLFVGDSLSSTRLNSANGPRALSYIDTNGVARIWRYVNDTSDPALELIWGTNDDATDTANRWWDIRLDEKDLMVFRRRTGNASEDFLTIGTTGEISFTSKLISTGPMSLESGAGEEMTFKDNAAGTISLQNLAGFHGLVTRIKILPSDFMGDEGDVEQNNGGYCEEDEVANLVVSVIIPMGYRATRAIIYGSDTNNAVNVYRCDINDNASTSVGSATIADDIDITDVDATDTNYLSIRVSPGNNDQIYGGYISMEKI